MPTEASQYHNAFAFYEGDNPADLRNPDFFFRPVSTEDLHFYQLSGLHADVGGPLRDDAPAAGWDWTWDRPVLTSPVHRRNG